jgi:hypothetical protein
MLLGIVPLTYAFICFFALVKSRRKLSAEGKFGVTLLALTFIAWANQTVATWMPYDLYHGDAQNGKIVSGHYFVGDRGRYTEVSRRFFENSVLYQQISGYIFAAFLICSILVIWRARRRQSRRANQ